MSGRDGGPRKDEAMEGTRQLLLLLGLRLETARNALLGFRRHSKLKIAVITIVAGGFWFAMFWIFYRGFVIINRYLEGLVGLDETLLAVFFFSLGMMLAVSNTQISYAGLYRSKETVFLAALPLEGEAVFLYKLIESVMFSSWAFAFLGLPVMLAYGLSHRAPPDFYVWLIPYFGAFLALPAVVGGVAALAIRCFMPARVRKIFLIVAVALAVGLILVGLRLASSVSQSSFLNYYWVRKQLDRLEFCQNPLFPSQWATKGMVLAARGKRAEAGFYLGVLLSNAAFLGMLAVLLAERLWQASWGRTGLGERVRRASRLCFEPFLPVGRTLSLLMQKDALIFVRDPVQWSQCAIFFGLLAIYVLNLRSLRFTITEPIWMNFTSFLNLLTSTLVLSTLTTRFVFPSISMEGRQFWILGLMPLSRQELLWSKFLFSFLGSLLITEGIVLVSDAMLGVGLTTTLMHAACVTMISAGLSGMATGLGAIYRDPRAEDPAKVVAGFGGTLTLILSIGYVVGCVTAVGVPFHLGHLKLLGPAAVGFWAAAGLFLVLAGTALAVLLPMELGARALRQAEF